ncbi:hypothetical protein P7K49_009899 [Saguinus oedipus]|uniref:FAM65 N-terminal domain-containing protein n=1 Tax=Saguinus oedipus TaxID=9490 RepID=A0ABQ9VNK8_SAGOE|nr:hypothetical protein P7K49_009899 [Saguinus oedipus]
MEGRRETGRICVPGLVGYARLCPGDQYEVFMRLGRQRWKLKGRIESDDSQTWDEEEKAFIPTLHENLDIKVMELRGLGSLAVGAVTCDIADFFTTWPQVIVVDITELGTIKLQLEVQWNWRPGLSLQPPPAFLALLPFLLRNPWRLKPQGLKLGGHFPGPPGLGSSEEAHLSRKALLAAPTPSFLAYPGCLQAQG